MARQGLRRGAWMTVWIGAGVCMLGGDLSTAGTAEKEGREFNVKINGRQAGRYQMTIRRPDDHTFIVDSRADVAISYLVRKYKYMYQGTEEWKAGRLVHLKSESNDDGKQFQVLVQVDGDRLRVWVNGKDHTTRQDVWTTTYWRLPEPPGHNQEVALLDCDTGKDLHGTMQYVGIDQLSVLGQVQNCVHYRIRGDVIVDVWYDAQKRLVRQESVDQGQRVVLELTRIER